jgi:hypothetical protein
MAYAIYAVSIKKRAIKTALGLPFIYIYHNIYLKRSIKAYHPQI